MTDPVADLQAAVATLQNQVMHLMTRGLKILLAADVYQGDPLVNIDFDGQRIVTGYDIAALHSAGNWQLFVFTGMAIDGTLPHTVAITLTNDAWSGVSGPTTDRNVYVGGISINGALQSASIGALQGNGTLTFKVGTWPKPAPTPTPTPTPTPSGGKVPNPLLGINWFRWNSPTVASIMQSAPKYNVLMAHCAQANAGTAQFNFGTEADSDFAAGVQAWKAAGKLALLNFTHEGPVSLYTDADAQNGANSLGGIIDRYGFQGICIDLEDTTRYNVSTVVSMCQKLRARYGAPFVFSMAPRPYEWRGGGVYQQMAAGMKSAGCGPDFIGFQFYDGAFGNTTTARQYMQSDNQDAVNHGFPMNVMVIGCESSRYVGGGTAPPTQTYIDGINMLKSSIGTPLGAFCWHAGDERDSGWDFHRQMAPVLGL